MLLDGLYVLVRNVAAVLLLFFLDTAISAADRGGHRTQHTAVCELGTRKTASLSREVTLRYFQDLRFISYLLTCHVVVLQ